MNQETKISIENGDKYIITTDAGRFEMPIELAMLYRKNISSKLSKSKGEEDIQKEALEERIDKLLIETFSYHEVNDIYTWFEHRACGGTSQLFLGQAFMGTFKADPKWASEIREKRKAINYNTIVLYKSAKGERSGVGFCDKVTSYPFCVSNIDNRQSSLVNSLLHIYDRCKSKDAPEFDSLSQVKVLLKPNQYNDQMQAFPEAMAIEFLQGNLIIASNADPKILRILEPKPDDVRLADKLQDPETGNTVYVGSETRGYTHRLKIIPETKFWFLEYRDRITSELEMAIK